MHNVTNVGNASVGNRMRATTSALLPAEASLFFAGQSRSGLSAPDFVAPSWKRHVTRDLPV